jgi:hypothetical protein
MATEPNSSNIALRLPSSMKDWLANVAASAGRSLNAEIVARLYNSMPGRKSSGDAFDELELPELMRMRPGRSSTDCVDALVDITDQFGVESLLLVARRDDLNHACLTVLLEAPAFSVLADDLPLSLARRPRAQELERLFCAWNARGLIDSCRLTTKLVSPTSTLPVSEAYSLIAREGGIKPSITGKDTADPLNRFLELLAGHKEFDLQRFLTASSESPPRGRPSDRASLRSWVMPSRHTAT